MSNEITLSLNYEIINNDETTPVETLVYDSDEVIDQMVAELQTKIDELSISMDNLVNKADSLDYAIAVSSGILSSLIDIFVVKELNFDFDSAKKQTYEDINRFIINFSKKRGYNGERLSGAINHLENNFKVAQDNIWKGRNIGVSAKSHHLDDLAHHPSLLGLVSAVFVEMLNIGVFSNKSGSLKVLKTEEFFCPAILTGLFKWIINIYTAKQIDELEDELPKPIRDLLKFVACAPIIIDILKVADNWMAHLVSDLGGSKNTSGGGMGIPGLFVSFIKELSMLPFLNKTDLPKIANNLYQKHKLDMRNELAIGKTVVKELGRQSIPLLINETLIRSFYFIRHLVEELKEKKTLIDVEWENLIPIGNRTVERMITISTGVFTGIDALDAVVEGAINSKGTWVGFMKNTVLRLNFVGIGRFTVALGNDFYKSYQLSKKNDEVYLLRCKQLYLLNAKVFYKNQQMWQLAENVDESMNELFALLSTTLVESSNIIEETINKIENISVDDMEEQNEGLSAEILDIIS